MHLANPSNSGMVLLLLQYLLSPSIWARSDIAEGSSVWENFTFSKILQPHLLSRSRALTSYKRRHHGDASSALQRMHHIYGKARLLKYIALYSQLCENERKLICRDTALLLDALLLNDRKQPKMRTPTQLIVRDAVDRNCYCVQHSLMHVIKTTQQTMHFFQHCHAQKFQKKPLGICCANGKVVLLLLPAAPEPLASMLAGTRDDSKDILTNVMRCKACFQVTSFGATQKCNDEGWMPTFKVQEQVYHLTGSLLPVGLACIVLCANRIGLLLALQWQYAFHAHSFTQSNTFYNTHNCVFTCKKRSSCVGLKGRKSRPQATFR